MINHSCPGKTTMLIQRTRITCDDVDDLDDQQFFVQPLSLCLQRTILLKRKRGEYLLQGKRHVDMYFTLSTANTPRKVLAILLQILMMITPTDVFSSKLFDADEGE
ncbi:hypothetical protein Tco_0475438 [Tanacetum coccineum]